MDEATKKKLQNALVVALKEQKDGETKRGRCKHGLFKDPGGSRWDGISFVGEVIRGPIVNCALCGKEFYFTWDEWGAISKEVKD